MSQPATFNFTGTHKLRIGVDWRWSLIFRAAGQEDIEGNPIPIDISGNGFILQARKSGEASPVEFELSTDKGDLVVANGPGGLLQCVMPRNDTYRVSPGTYTYGLIRIVGGTQHLAVLEGAIETVYFANR